MENPTLLAWVYCGEFTQGEKVHVVKTIKVRQEKGRFVDIFKKATDESYFWKEISPHAILTIERVPEDEVVDGGGLHSSYFPGYYSVKTEDGTTIIGIPTNLLQKYR